MSGEYVILCTAACATMHLNQDWRLEYNEAELTQENAKQTSPI